MRIQEDSSKGIAVRYFFILTVWRQPKYRLKVRTPQNQRIFKIFDRKSEFIPAVCQVPAGRDKAVVISGIFSANPLVTGKEIPAGKGIISLHQVSIQRNEKTVLGILAEKNFRKAMTTRIRREAERLICNRLIGLLHFIDHLL